MDISIRKASDSDLKLIQEFGSRLLNFERENYDSSLDSNWAFSDEAKAKYLVAIRERYVIIAELDGRAVGFLIGSVATPKPGNARPIKQAMLQNIYVDSSQRGIGVGKRLVEEFKAYCKGENVDRINVSVMAANKVAISMYEKVGFSPRSINLAMELT